MKVLSTQELKSVSGAGLLDNVIGSAGNLQGAVGGIPSSLPVVGRVINDTINRVISVFTPAVTSLPGALIGGARP